MLGVLGDTFLSQRVVKIWNSLDQETVDVGSINSFKGRLDKMRKTRIWVFMDSAWSANGAKPYASWRWDPMWPHKVSYKVSYFVTTDQ